MSKDGNRAKKKNQRYINKNVTNESKINKQKIDLRKLPNGFF